MERKIQTDLFLWRQSSHRKPLIVQGARQVGKTFSILYFGKKYYKNVVYLNFESMSELSSIFERDLDPIRILRELSVFSGTTITADDCLIFFDEIQASQRALTSLKYFNEQAPQYHVVAAGSLLGVAINRDAFSFPVGKVDLLHLFPLDFEEFLWALGQTEAVSIIRECFQKNEVCNIHQRMLDYYKEYLCIGGMPQVVKEYVETQDFNFVSVLQKNINDAYIADMAKYASPFETVRIMGTYNSIAAQLAKENKKFQYKLIKSGAKAGVYEAPLDWLKASGIIIRCEKINEGKFPVSAYIDPSSFKIYMRDNGLLCSKYGISLNNMRSEISGMNDVKGILAENYVATTLVSNSYTPLYWESQGKAEVDFVIQTPNGEVIPIEVKSSENVRSKSLQQFVSKYNPTYSIRFSTKNFGLENNIKSVPLYGAFCV